MRGLSRSIKLQILLPLVLVAAALTGVIVHAQNTKPPHNIRAASAGLHSLNNDKAEAAASPTPSPSSDSTTPEPSSHAVANVPSTTPTPSPVLKPTTVEDIAQPTKDTPASVNCLALQQTWKDSLTQTTINAEWQRVQGLLSMLLNIGQQNAIIDTYNNTVQGAYTNLLGQAKSAQCNLGLSAPKLYPRVH